MGEGTTMTLRRPIEDDESQNRTEEVAMLETARSAAESSSEKSPAPKKEEEGMSLFWRVFGGTILSIVALVSITLFNNMSSSITELRNEVSREREARAEMVKKEEFNARVTAQYERMRGIDALKVELEGMKEKVHTNATALETVKRDANAAVESVKKDNVASADAMKKDAAALEILKEKEATTAAEVKSLRDQVSKLVGEVEKNKTYDLERKTTRDTQYKQVEETLKDLQKALQDCREKLARLEGGKPIPVKQDGEK
jgi:hypothetical protein